MNVEADRLRASGLAAGCVAGVIAVASAASPLLGPFLPHASLSGAERMSSVGIVVPAAAHPCATQPVGLEAAIRWCLNGRVGVSALEHWYAHALPSGQSTAALRWCVAQVRSDGTRRSLWTNAHGGLVGYDLPAHPGVGNTSAVITVVALPGRGCPPAARSTRTGATL